MGEACMVGVLGQLARIGLICQCVVPPAVWWGLRMVGNRPDGNVYSLLVPNVTTKPDKQIKARRMHAWCVVSPSICVYSSVLL